MFSYRHAFHAGNHADVLKHSILVNVLDYFNQKDNPWWLIDTHAGAGLYDLRSDWAMQKGECIDGLDRLLSATQHPDLIQRYLEEVQYFNTDGHANFYPGSPWLALRALRTRDRLRLFELHPTEIDVLSQNLKEEGQLNGRQTQVFHKDGFDGLKALLPPPTRRAIVIIDPSYEDKNDYKRTLQTLQDAIKRFATGCYMVWYPLVQRREAHDMARAMERLTTPWVHASLTVRKPSADGFGLYGSGMFIVNPPWTLHGELKQTLPWLKKVLAQDDRASYTLTQQGN